MAEDEERGGIQVIARAAAVLRAVTASPEGLSLGDLADRTGLARSTVQRIVSALAAEQFLISAGARSGVTLGPALIRMAGAATIEVDRIARPVLESLSRDLGETVDLSVLQGRTAMFVDQVVGGRRLVALSAVGEAFPLHCTANGKAMLSCLTPERRDALVPRSLRRLTPNTEIDRAKLEREVAAIGPQDAAFDMEEHSEGICAAGAGFIDPVGRVFAISAPVPAERFRGKSAEVAQQIVAARDRLLKLLPGAHGPGRGA